jgi:hypothetical protein
MLFRNATTVSVTIEFEENCGEDNAMLSVPREF